MKLFTIGYEGEPQADATPTPTATASATPEVVREIVLQGQGNRAQGLMRVFRREQDGNLIFALAADNVPPNRSNEVYAVWFTREGGRPRNLGFAQTPVGEEGDEGRVLRAAADDDGRVRQRPAVAAAYR